MNISASRTWWCVLLAVVFFSFLVVTEGTLNVVHRQVYPFFRWPQLGTPILAKAGPYGSVVAVFGYGSILVCNVSCAQQQILDAVIVDVAVHPLRRDLSAVPSPDGSTCMSMGPLWARWGNGKSGQ